VQLDKIHPVPFIHPEVLLIFSAGKQLGLQVYRAFFDVNFFKERWSKSYSQPVNFPWPLLKPLVIKFEIHVKDSDHFFPGASLLIPKGISNCASLNSKKKMMLSNSLIIHQV